MSMMVIGMYDVSRSIGRYLNVDTIDSMERIYCTDVKVLSESEYKYCIIVVTC